MCEKMKSTTEKYPLNKASFRLNNGKFSIKNFNCSYTLNSKRKLNFPQLINRGIFFGK